jgi:hypothetical protein
VGVLKTSSFAATRGSLDHNMSPERSSAAESIVHQVPKDTVTLDADDFVVPEPEVEVALEAPAPLAPELGEFEALAVSWPEISGEEKNAGIDDEDPFHDGNMAPTMSRGTNERYLHCWNVGRE